MSDSPEAHGLISSKKLRSLLSALPVVMYAARPSGDYGATFVTENVKHLTGFNALDFIKDPNFWFDRIHPEDRARVSFETLKIFPESEVTYEYRFRCKDDHYIWVRDGLRLVCDSSGKPLEIVGYWVDVTREKNAELELQKVYRDLSARLEERTAELIKRDEQVTAEIEYRMSAVEQATMKDEYCRALLSHIHEDILVINREFRVTDMNSSVLLTGGLPREEVIGRRCFEVLHGLGEPCERHGEKCKLREVLDTGTPAAYRHYHVSNAGKPVLVSVLLSPLRDHTGEVTGVIVAMRDLTEVVARERRQERLEEDYRSLFQDSMDAIAVTSRHGQFINVNQAMLDLIGYTREEIGKLPVIETYVDPQDRPKFQEAMERNGYVKDYALRLRKKDGTVVLATMTARTRYASDGTVIGYEGIMRDMTAARKIQEKLRRSEKELKIKTKRLEEANATLRVLLKKVNRDTKGVEELVVTHVKDLIIPFIKKLRKSRLDGRQKGYIGVLESNLQKMLEPFAHNLSSRHSSLTPAEIQVAHLIKEGKSSKEVAELLSLSIRTVGCHREHIRAKLGLKNKHLNLRAQLIASNNAEPLSAFHR